MKKMFFTAIALVAFSSVSMANTIADEEVVRENEEKCSAVIKRNPCIENAMDTLYCIAEANPGFDNVTLNGIFQCLIAKC